MKLRKFCTISEAADRLGLKYLDVHSMTESGRIPYTFFGMNVRAIRRSDVAALEASQDSHDIEGNKERQIKEDNPDDLMKPGEYYTLEQTAEQLGVSNLTIIEALDAGSIKKELFGGAIAIHESQVERFTQIKAWRRTEVKWEAKEELLSAGFVYSRNPPSGAPRGSSRNPSPFRRGWSKDGVYYGLTAVKALREWQKVGTNR